MWIFVNCVEGVVRLRLCTTRILSTSLTTPDMFPRQTLSERNICVNCISRYKLSAAASPRNLHVRVQAASVGLSSTVAKIRQATSKGRSIKPSILFAKTQDEWNISGRREGVQCRILLIWNGGGSVKRGRLSDALLIITCHTRDRRVELERRLSFSRVLPATSHSCLAVSHSRRFSIYLE